MCRCHFRNNVKLVENGLFCAFTFNENNGWGAYVTCVYFNLCVNARGCSTNEWIKLKHIFMPSVHCYYDEIISEAARKIPKVLEQNRLVSLFFIDAICAGCSFILLFFFFFCRSIPLPFDLQLNTRKQHNGRDIVKMLISCSYNLCFRFDCFVRCAPIMYRFQ